MLNQERIRTFGEKENYKYWKILEMEMKEKKIEAEMKEKNSGRVSLTNEKTSQNQFQQKKSHQSDKYGGVPPL